MSTSRSIASLILLVLTALPAAVGAQEDPHRQHRAAAAAEPEKGELTGLDIPDVPVLDQEGRRLHFRTDLVEGRVVAINFLFTNCTTICPPLGATFGKLRKLLGDRAGRDVHLISISVDPTTDTPARLKAWAAKFGEGPGWSLVTGTREDITRLLKALGAYTADMNDHPPLVLIGNRRGQWTRAYGLAPPTKLAAVIDEVAGLAAAAGDKQGAPR
jgi:protein SCO1/2